ncbi:MAG: lipid biosynthesis B12-binding/radical SAM protein [bacterium]
MKRILLVSSNISTEPLPVYPLGLAVVAAGLAGAGHRVEQFDFLASGESEAVFREKIVSFDPDYVCISLRNLDNCDSTCPVGYPEIAKRLVGRIREVSGAPVIIGGPGFSILPEELLAFTGADHGVVGEGERVLCDLIRDLSEGRTPPPIVRGDRLLDGAEMASPLYNGGMIAYYLDRSGMLNLQTKRGCPHGCVYCIYPSLEGDRFRFRDPAAVVEDIARAGVEHGVESFFFTDSIFNDPQGRYLSIAEEILRRELRIRWCCYMRPERIGRKEIALLKRAGMYAVELGTDAACDRTLRSLGKGFTFADALEVNRACVAERLPCAHFVMFGGPGETVGTVAEGLANLERLEHTVVFAYSGIRILPGTALHGLAVAEGVLSPGASLIEPVYYLSSRVDADTMNGMIAASFRGRRDRIFPPAEGQKRLEVLHNFGFRGLLWDHLIRFPRDPEC